MHRSIDHGKIVGKVGNTVIPSHLQLCDNERNDNQQERSGDHILQVLLNSVTRQ